MFKFSKFLAAVFLAGAATVFAQIPAPQEKDVQKNRILSSEAALENARSALELGMPAISENMSEKLVASLPEGGRDLACFVLADSLIAQGKFENAGKILPLFANQHTPEFLMRKAIVSLQLGDVYGAHEIVSKLSADALSEKSRAWFYVARGAILFNEGNFRSAADDFSAAKKLAASDAVKREADALVNLCRMSEELGAKDLETFASELSLKTSLFMGTNAGVQFAKQYAVLLDRLNRKQEALSVIENALNIALMSDIDRDELQLISSSIEPSNERKRALLSSLLKTTKSPAATEQAIYLLRASFGGDTQSYADMLKGVLNEGS
ncbi:MAG: hypothetical protein J6R08_00315, partial [Opitutales bacterium]|nr:hypothetical protein [Opitutales bacterium]